MIKYNKKGQVGGLATNIILVAGAAITFIMIMLILQSLTNNSTIRDAYALTVNNESSFINGTTDTVNVNTYPGAHGYTIVKAYNRSSGLVIAPGNYSINSDTGVITNASSIQWNSVNITYSFTYGGEAYTGSNDTLSGIGNFSDFWTIIVLAIVAAVVLGIIFGVFGKRSKSR